MISRSSVVFVALLASAGASAQSQPVQWRIEDGGNGHWYRYDGETQSRQTAQSRADAARGHLVTITSPAEYSFLRAAFPQVASNMFWMGGYQTPGSCEPGCGWHWLTGETWQYINWSAGEPNNVGGEPWLGCLSDGTWNDFHSGWNLKSMIEWSVDCNGDGIVDYGQLLSGDLADLNANGVPDCCDNGAPCANPCPADVIRDGEVDGADLAAVLSQWGTSGASPGNADVDDDGIVEGKDLAIVLSAWGACQ